MEKNEPSSYHYLDMVREDILEMVPIEGQIIGSIGCGRAKTEGILVEQGREVHGVDISEEAIKVAQNRITTAKCIRPDNKLPFEKESLDGLILADVLEHLPTAWVYLLSYATMLKKGGWLVISVPNMRYLPVLYMLGIKGDWPEHHQGIFDKTHVQVMTHHRLYRWCEDAGLSDLRWHDCYDYRFLQRNISRVLNVCSFKLFRGYLVSEIQCILVRK